MLQKQPAKKICKLCTMGWIWLIYVRFLLWCKCANQDLVTQYMNNPLMNASNLNDSCNVKISRKAMLLHFSTNSRRAFSLGWQSMPSNLHLVSSIRMKVVVTNVNNNLTWLSYGHWRGFFFVIYSGVQLTRSWCLSQLLLESHRPWDNARWSKQLSCLW